MPKISCVVAIRRFSRPRLRQLDRAQARPGFPVVSGARRLPRHPRPDCARRSRGPAGCDCRAGRRSGPGQSRGAGAADRRPFARRRVRRIRSRCVRKEPGDRRPAQRGSLSLHRLDQARVQERRRDSAGQRHHAPDQPGANVAGDSRAGRCRLPGHAGRHRQPHATRRCARRDRRRRRRPRSRKRHAGPCFMDAAARHHRRAAHRQAATRHHCHRHRAGADRVPAPAESGGCVPGVLRRRRLRVDAGRSRDDLEHGAGVRRDGGDVLHRRADDHVPAAHWP